MFLLLSQIVPIVIITFIKLECNIQVRIHILKNQNLSIHYCHHLSLCLPIKHCHTALSLSLSFYYNLITRAHERCTLIVVGQLANLESSTICIHRYVKCYVYFSRDTLGCNCSLSTTGESPTSSIFVHKNIDSKKDVNLFEICRNVRRS